MASAREMRLRIRSIKNISQVTKALETVSASKVRRAMAAYAATRPYAEKAWSVLVHLARQPSHGSLHPLLHDRGTIQRALVIMISGDRGLAGAYNTNILRFTLDKFDELPYPVRYITVGRKGRDMLVRRRKEVIAEFSNLPASPSFMDISPIGRLVVDEFLNGHVDQVHLVYTRFTNMVVQTPVQQQLLPYEVPGVADTPGQNPLQKSVFTYEPDGSEILDLVLRRFTAVQVYQAVLSSLASEHAARMVAMRNATENAHDLITMLQLEYNKSRQQAITGDILDIVGGVEALAKSTNHSVSRKEPLEVVKNG